MSTQCKIINDQTTKLKTKYLSLMKKWKDYKVVFQSSISDRQVQSWAELGHEEAKVALEYRKDRKVMTKIASQLDQLTNMRGQLC